MSHLRLLVLSAGVLAAFTSVVYAGPCAQEIERMAALVDAKLAAAARTGPPAPESTAATTHRQPTPSSIAAAESKLGDISPHTIEGVRVAIAAARTADLAGDVSTCKQALAEVQRAVGQ